LALNLPFSVVSVSLVQVLVRDVMSEGPWMKVILLLAVAAVLTLTAGFFYWYKQRHRHWAATLAGILALGMLVGCWFLGFHDAMLDSGCESRLPVITFASIAPTDQASLPCQPGSTDICYLVLHINNAYHYFLAADPDWCKTAGSSLPGLLGVPGATRNTYEISDAQVRIATIGHHIGW
jgi:hypothetical protein